MSELAFNANGDTRAGTGSGVPSPYSRRLFRSERAWPPRAFVFKPSTNGATYDPGSCPRADPRADPYDPGSCPRADPTRVRG